MPTLQILTVSTRDDRKGPLVAAWFLDQARAHGGFDLEPVDLAEVGLPLFDEPKHPRFGDYAHEHTRRWSAIVDARRRLRLRHARSTTTAPPPSLINALDYLIREWAYKPVGFVSYGGVSAGTRAVQMAKQIVTSLKMVPLFEAVSIPFFTKAIDARDRALRPRRGAGEGRRGDARRAVALGTSAAPAAHRRDLRRPRAALTRPRGAGRARAAPVLRLLGEQHDLAGVIAHVLDRRGRRRRGGSWCSPAPRSALQQSRRPTLDHLRRASPSMRSPCSSSPRLWVRRPWTRRRGRAGTPDRPGSREHPQRQVAAQMEHQVADAVAPLAGAPPDLFELRGDRRRNGSSRSTPRDSGWPER